MPKRTDIKTVLIIGSGPIVIGQGCEFDYSGVQACKALYEEGFRVVLINSNPATIMTDPEIAHATYIEPLILESIKKIIQLEKVDAILPTMGGQVALNLAMDLWYSGFLHEHSIELIGAKPEAILAAEDRNLFKQKMHEIDLQSPKSFIVKSFQEAQQAARELKFPLIIRPSFTLGGAGGGVVNAYKELKEKIVFGLAQSPIGQVLLEESLLGWKEFEMEVMRDSADNCVIVCAIENIDPMGVHTGDSITVAPALTLTDKEYQCLRNASIKIMQKIGIETGGANVQFAINPKDGRMVVIEMNPRVSRSSALASKATGFPIAKIAAKLAIGYRLDEIKNDITNQTLAAFEPSIDYVVTKIPRFDFHKFPHAKGVLSTYMQSVGEVMSIGRSFLESLQKGIRSLEIGLDGFNSIGHSALSSDQISEALKTPTPLRFLWVAEALRNNFTIKKISQLSGIDPWFLAQIRLLINHEDKIKNSNLDEYSLRKAKYLGFTDQRIADLKKSSIADIQGLKQTYNIHPVYKCVDTCAAEFDATTSYLYSTYEFNYSNLSNCEASPISDKKVIIIGSGPNRIGQGIEFDYSCVKAIQALKKRNIKAIIINCNPETVSTDYSVSDRLYCEPLTEENVIEVIKKESETGSLIGVITQFGGQTSLKLTKALREANIPILGSSLGTIDTCEDRNKFRTFCQEILIPQPKNKVISNKTELLEALAHIGFPIIIRPSYIIGGSFMKIFSSLEELKKDAFLKELKTLGPLLIEKFLESAKEVEVDGISDGEKIHIFAIMEHFEPAGIHSGDSVSSLTPFSLNPSVVDKIKQYCEIIIKKLNVKGLFNIQFAIDKAGQVFVIEVNPRASRTIPFVSKSIAVPIIELAVQVLLGGKVPEIQTKLNPSLFFIKKPIFSFKKIPECIGMLGPEMRSTGEIMAMGKTLEEALIKAELSDPFNYWPKEGVIEVCQNEGSLAYYNWDKFENMGFQLKVLNQQTACDILVCFQNCCTNKIKNKKIITSKTALNLLEKILSYRNNNRFNVVSLQNMHSEENHVVH